MEFRRLVETDFPKQREVFALSFPEAVGTPAETRPFYEWKFRSNPESPSSHEFVCLEDGNILGYYAALPLHYKVGQERFRAGLVVDVMTHPNARGKGIFVKTGRFAIGQLQEDGFDFTMGYPIRPEVLPGHIKVGWKVAFELPMYLRVLRSDSLLVGRAPAALAGVFNPLLRLTSGLLSIGRPQAEQVDEVDVQAFLDAPETWTFFEKLHAQVRNIWLREPAPMRWRLSRPDAEYVVLVHRNASGAVDGCLIGRATDLKGVKTFAILDVSGLECAATDALLRAAEAKALALGLDTLSMIQSRHQASKTRLIRHGYLRSPFVFKLIIRDLTDGRAMPELHNEATWHLGWLDTDDV